MLCTSIEFIFVPCFSKDLFYSKTAGNVQKHLILMRNPDLSYGN